MAKASTLAEEMFILLAVILLPELMTAIRTKPRDPEKVNMLIEIVKLRVAEGVIFEGKKM